MGVGLVFVPSFSRILTSLVSLPDLAVRYILLQYAGFCLPHHRLRRADSDTYIFHHLLPAPSIAPTPQQCALDRVFADKFNARRLTSGVLVYDYAKCHVLVAQPVE